jgi:hypothetical protein
MQQLCAVSFAIIKWTLRYPAQTMGRPVTPPSLLIHTHQPEEEQQKKEGLCPMCVQHTSNAHNPISMNALDRFTCH